MDNQLHYCATDNEIYEVLMSSKQKMTEVVLLEIAKDRGIFFSSKDSREVLADKIALLPHDYHDLSLILEQREHAGRSEKITSVIFNAGLTMDDIKEVAKEYRDQPQKDEKVLSYAEGNDRYVVKVKYSEMDYSRTRLIQRKPKEADIEFIVEGEQTTVRMPANHKSKEVFDKLKTRLDNRKKTDLPVVLIEISEFESAAQRTSFFTSLISTIPDFKLDNVTSVKVEPIDNDTRYDLDDDQEIEQAKEEALSLVRKVALAGESLLASEEYQSLQRKGFFITSIIWRSKKIYEPLSIVEFEAAFEEPHAGKGFKYSVRGALNFTGREYTKTLRPIVENLKQQYQSLIEQTAMQVVAGIRAEASKVETKDPQQDMK